MINTIFIYSHFSVYPKIVLPFFTKIRFWFIKLLLTKRELENIQYAVNNDLGHCFRDINEYEQDIIELRTIKRLLK